MEFRNKYFVTIANSQNNNNKYDLTQKFELYFLLIHICIHLCTVVHINILFIRYNTKITWLLIQKQFLISNTIIHLERERERGRECVCVCVCVH